MYGSRTSRKCYNTLVLSNKHFKVFFKSIDIRAKGNNPIGIKGFLDKLLLVSTQMAEAKKDSVFSSFHNKNLLFNYFFLIA